jgi:hypothetical protein
MRLTNVPAFVAVRLTLRRFKKLSGDFCRAATPRPGHGLAGDRRRRIADGCGWRTFDRMAGTGGFYWGVSWRE